MSAFFSFLLIIQALVALAMITVILMQRSEGGGFAGGSPSGMMSARGAADFLTRSTAVLAALFVALSILLAALAASQGGPRQLDPSLMRPGAPAAPAAPASTPAPGGAVPGAQPKAAPAPTAPATPAQGNQSGVPLAQ